MAEHHDNADSVGKRQNQHASHQREAVADCQRAVGTCRLLSGGSIQRRFCDARPAAVLLRDVLVQRVQARKAIGEGVVVVQLSAVESRLSAGEPVDLDQLQSGADVEFWLSYGEPFLKA